MPEIGVTTPSEITGGGLYSFTATPGGTAMPGQTSLIYPPGVTDIYNQLVNACMSPFTAWSTAPQVFYGAMPMEVALAQAATYGAAWRRTRACRWR